ncbi:MAG: hypothetical protein PVJ21_12540 [Anaerolineales bacterium]
MAEQTNLMNITFQRQTGKPDSNISFTWMMTIQADSPQTITDRLIPELFFDYFYVKEGEVKYVDSVQDTEILLTSQTLKALYTRPFKFVFSTPLVLFGARLSLEFTESFWDKMKANCFLEQLSKTSKDSLTHSKSRLKKVHRSRI